MTLGGQRNKDLVSGVVFLTDDQTAMEAQLKRMKQHLDGKGVPVGISTEGIEGPGAYGLNRKVTLTVLIGNKNKVTANYALIQPSVEADMPKILKDISKQIGGKVATVKSLGGERYMRNRKTRRPNARENANPRNKPVDERLIGLLRAVIKKQATDDEVEKAAKRLEDYVADKPAARQDIFRRTDLVTNGPKFKDYGTELARKYLLKWAKEYAPKKPNETQTDRKPKTDGKPNTDREKKTDGEEKSKSSPKKSD
jgi:hypothetical protein